MDGQLPAAEKQQAVLKPRIRRKPDGGFRFIKAYSLLWVYFAFRATKIRWVDLRVWFACYEAVARRCEPKNGTPSSFSVAEIERLVGGGEGRVHSSIKRLEAVGLLHFSKEAITFAESPDELKIDVLSEFWAMVEAFGQENRRVPVPRRTIRLIAGGARKIVTATMLGEILRCCYYTKSGYVCEGSCAASWVAIVFGINERNVKAARKHLIEIGWLLPKESDPWHRRRYGARAVVNPHWSRPIVPAIEQQGTAKVEPKECVLAGSSDNQAAQFSSATSQPTEVKPVACRAVTNANGQTETNVASVSRNLTMKSGRGEGAHKRSPQEPVFPHKRSPQGVPIRNKNKTLFEELQKPEPAWADQTGVCKKTEGVEKPSREPIAKTLTELKKLKAPTMRHVEVEDLRDTERTLKLFEDATQQGLVKNCEADRLKFLAAAERAITVGTQNPPGLFSRIVRAKLWNHLTQDDEDAAQRRLKKHFFGSSPPAKLRLLAEKQTKLELSKDAQLMVAVKRLANAHNLTCGAFELLRRERPEWTRDRWNAAEEEFQRFRLSQASSTFTG